MPIVIKINIMLAVRDNIGLVRVTLIRLFLIISLLFINGGIAYASEDSDEYPFPEGFSFDDLPDIDTTETQATSEPAEPTSTDTVTENSNPQNVSDFLPSSLDELPDIEPLNSENSSDADTKTDNAEIVPLPDTAPPILEAPKTDENNDILQKDESLTSALKEDSKNSSSPIEGTWVEKITSSNPLSILNSDEKSGKSQLEDLLEKSRDNENKGRSNASVFDIAGVMLRMNLRQAVKTLENRGFQKINAKFQIPNFIKWRNEEACRSEGVVGYERLEACVINKAKKGGYQYVQYLKYAKFDSKEEIEVYFTSNFTENKVYKIVYNSRIASITGNSPKAIYIRNLKVYDFWKTVNRKYGNPDNKTTVTWGLGGNKPYLKAATGYLLLEDPMFVEMDYTRMSREDQRFINSDFYNF